MPVIDIFHGAAFTVSTSMTSKLVDNSELGKNIIILLTGKKTGTVAKIFLEATRRLEKVTHIFSRLVYRILILNR